MNSQVEALVLTYVLVGIIMAWWGTGTMNRSIWRKARHWEKGVVYFLYGALWPFILITSLLRGKF